MSEDLAKQLASYKAQLQQVEAALSGNGENEDLLKLKKDLQVSMGQYIIASLLEKSISVAYCLESMGTHNTFGGSVSPLHTPCVYMCAPTEAYLASKRRVASSICVHQNS